VLVAMMCRCRTGDAPILETP